MAKKKEPEPTPVDWDPDRHPTDEDVKAPEPKKDPTDLPTGTRSRR